MILMMWGFEKRVGVFEAVVGARGGGCGGGWVGVVVVEWWGRGGGGGGVVGWWLGFGVGGWKRRDNIMGGHLSHFAPK